MAVEEAHTEETPYGSYVTSEGWFVHNLQEALAVRFQQGGALYPLEPREAPFRDIGVNVRVLWPDDANALYHHEDAQEGFLVLSGECLLVVEEQERRLRRWDYFHCPPGTRHVIVGAGGGPCVVLMIGARPAGGDIRLPGERRRGEVRRVGLEGHERPGRGVRRAVGRLRAGAPPLARGLSARVVATPSRPHTAARPKSSTSMCTCPTGSNPSRSRIGRDIEPPCVISTGVSRATASSQRARMSAR